ncbi:hypothetical protein JXA31_04075 [Candidatus Bathyarchaeota archaeon]|nr:hypothetical protein [Candidatus Bathyarchaeota archaeon]
MSRTRKAKLETCTDASLQLVTENATEESAVTAADDYIEVALEKKKKEANEPLYLKRI